LSAKSGSFTSVKCYLVNIYHSNVSLIAASGAKWLTFYRNIPLDQSKWEHKPSRTLWVLTKYLDPAVEQPFAGCG
jgi:hypothetical protein